MFNPNEAPTGFNEPRTFWKSFNRIRANHGLCSSLKHKWGFLDSPLVLAGSMILLAASASLYDLYLGPSPENLRKDKGFFTNLFLCFSVKNNLLHLPRKRENAGGLNIMFGIRFISTASIIVSHKFLHVLLGPIQNPGYIEETNRDPSYTWFLHGDLVVDTFFTSGAFLLSYFLTKQLEKKDVGISMLYIFRYVRLTPVLMAVMLFYSTILNKIGSGPLWEKITSPEKEKCLENWWTNILYINNYVNSDKMVNS
ncbi:hypothetical protein J437_LFUL014543 [Ladona fulva]|uniref:Acyltransferase 3 domain-containing protein n=1 Tax=Ladona fulva TaxID=123851 RepID=A0A8K0P8S1_LADFU|nr:hypothetical protein J437_LFUL014543 [Ladona fulva]